MRRLYPLILVLLYFKLNEGAKPEDCLTGTKATTNGCEDENECEFGNRCGPNANCYNTNGSFYCLCEPGHRTRSKKVNFTEGQCKDINECLGDHQICGENTVCNNTLGSFNCSCAAGFVSSNGQKWLDVSQNVTCTSMSVRTEASVETILSVITPLVLISALVIPVFCPETKKRPLMQAKELHAQTSMSVWKIKSVVIMLSAITPLVPVTALVIWVLGPAMDRSSLMYLKVLHVKVRCV
ncbi:adhesion G protein-coupled receptor L4 isoform X3 [Trichomycterus rosablanca]|uniref:adhesion G protein-coupled receptor L4 isoform X3 n=1 Tax=Trichomycterus rosablanca TaxID=2290929 RepID=UPI002F34F661